jgi:hypothetical protein
MANANDYAQWIISNKDKKGSKEFEIVAKAYEVAKQQETAPIEFSAAKTLENVPSSALQYGKNLATAITSPLQTGRAILDIGAGALQNALPQNVVDFINQADANRPEALQAGVAARDVAGNVGQYYKERYGGKQNVLRAIQQDPVGVLSDVSGVLTGGATLAPKLATLGKVGAAIEPLSIAANTLGYGAAKVLPSTLPAKLYESAAKWSTTLSPAERANITQTALEQQIMPSYSGVGKAQTTINVLGNRIDELIANATEANVKIPAAKVFENLNNVRKELGGFKIEAQPDLAALNRIESNFRQYLKKNKITSVTPAQMQAFKQDIYQTGIYKKKNQVSTKAEDEAFKAMARAAKESIESKVPQVSALNAQQGQLLELMPNLERSAARIENRDLLGIGGGVKAAGGQALGDTTGAVLGATQSIFDMPKPKAWTALNLYKKQNQGLGVFGDNNPNASFIRQLLQQQGAYNNAPGLLYEQ